MHQAGEYYITTKMQAMVEYGYSGTKIVMMCTTCRLLHSYPVQDRSKGHQFLVTVLYRFNTIELRRTLWDELVHIAPGINQPWLIARDFNALLSPQDRQAGAPVTLADTQEFADCVRNIGIHDLPWKGDYYTWKNK